MTWAGFIACAVPIAVYAIMRVAAECYLSRRGQR